MSSQHVIVLCGEMAKKPKIKEEATCHAPPLE